MAKKRADKPAPVDLIDWSLIESLEGGIATRGYVPKEETGGRNRVVSGVTIGGGVDLGQWAPQEFRALGVPDALLRKLAPYFGPGGPEALAAAPLNLSEEEARTLTRAARSRVLANLEGDWLRATGLPLEALPPAALTVMASVCFQYGDLPTQCRRFWSACVRQDWPAVAAELWAFGDRYPTRRRRERAYLLAGLESAG